MVGEGSPAAAGKAGLSVRALAWLAPASHPSLHGPDTYPLGPCSSHDKMKSKFTLNYDIPQSYTFSSPLSYTMCRPNIEVNLWKAWRGGRITTCLFQEQVPGSPFTEGSVDIAEEQGKVCQSWRALRHHLKTSALTQTLLKNQKNMKWSRGEEGINLGGVEGRKQ